MYYNGLEAYLVKYGSISLQNHMKNAQFFLHYCTNLSTMHVNNTLDEKENVGIALEMASPPLLVSVVGD